jgi:6-phosphogluconolactonase
MKNWRWFVCAVVSFALSSIANAAEHELYVGTYTGKASKGIYKIRVNDATGTLGEPELAAEMGSPSFLAIDPVRRVLVAVGEIDRPKLGGGLRSFKIGDGGKLVPISEQPTGGGAPCHVNIHPSGKLVLVANYGGGSVASFPIDADGKLGPIASFIQHEGTGPDKGRQEKAHAHSINVDPTGQYALAADLGTDRVYVYKIDTNTAKLTPAGEAKIAPGSGPRHLCFDPDGKTARVINELKNTITSMKWDASTGKLETFDTTSTLPEDFKGESYTAEVVAHPTGKFVYGSNRRHDSIASLSVGDGGKLGDSGKLKLTGFAKEGVKEPRNFIVDPTGKWLLVGSQNGDSIVVFPIDHNTGIPGPAGVSTKVPSPVCLRLLSIGR